MLILFKLALPFLAIIGYSSFFARWLRLPLAPMFFAATAFIGFLQFLFAITGYLPHGTLLSLVFGILAFIYTGSRDFSQRRLQAKALENLITIRYYLIFAGFITALAWGIRFRIIDDYSFWGVMSKYLYTFNHLPNNDDFISGNFLTYTPGMACFHYFFYFATGQYSQFVGYLAQGAVLLSAFMILFDAGSLTASLVRTALIYILLSLGFGAAFLRMEVDAYVAVYVFAISFVFFKTKAGFAKTLFFPLLFLSLIKEIGLFFAVILGLGCLISGKKSLKNLASIALLFVGLVGLKLIWQFHCNHYGFHSFANAIHLHNALSALNPFNPYFYEVQRLFLEAVFFGRFSQIVAWPNIFTYAMLIGIWYKLPDLMQHKKYIRALQIKSMFLATLVVYSIMLYLLQAIVFEVGHTNGQLLAFQRYFNMILIPIILFSVLIYYEAVIHKQNHVWHKPIATAIISIGLVFVVSGKIERSRHYYQPESMDALVKRIQKQIPSDENGTICLKNAPSPSYETQLPLGYFLMPLKIKLQNAPVSCHYIIKWSKQGSQAVEILAYKKGKQSAALNAF